MSRKHDCGDSMFIEHQKVTPSQHMKNTSLSTEELLAETKHMRLPTIIELIDMSETTHQKVSKVDIDEAIFQPFPSEIVYQNFKPFETYQVNPVFCL